MNCPRCETALKGVIIEDSQVHACPNCDGTWYPDEALGEVTDFTFSELKETELSPSLVPDKLARVDRYAARSAAKRWLAIPTL